MMPKTARTLSIFFVCIILLASTADCYAAKATAPRPQVKEIQTALNQEGYKLKVDGVMGKNTKNALIKYQKVHKLPATGKGDEATLKHLGIK